MSQRKRFGSISMVRPNHKLSVNLVAWDHGGGLTSDIDIVARLLTKLECQVKINGRIIRRPRNLPERVFHGVQLRLRHGFARLGSGPVYDVNLFIESIAPRFIPYGRLNCFVPNPEWFRDENQRYLSQMDWVLCKTWDAVDIFEPLVPNTRYVGFASADKREPNFERTAEVIFFHAAGASRWKGTSAVVKAWCRHPEWPRLIVTQNPVSYGGQPIEKLPDAPNIEYITERLDDKAWKKHQNACQVHLCPSEAEGFGHMIVEAMSCGAVVITTDGSPMNELVTPERGVLVRSARAEPMRLGTACFVDVDDLERQISRVLEMAPRELWDLGQKARRWYETQCAAFENSMKLFIDEVRSGKLSGE